MDTTLLDDETLQAEADRKLFYESLQQHSLAAFCPMLSDALTPEPRVKRAPHLWRWRDVRSREC